MLEVSADPADSEISPLPSRFVQWVRECPGVRVNPKVRVVEGRESAKGFLAVASADVEEDEELFIFPEDVCLTYKSSNLKNTPDFDSLPEELGPWLCLMLTMVYEFLRDKKSPWFPYLSTLPSSFDSLMFWSKEELEELQGSAVIDRIGKSDADLAILNQLLPIILKHPEVFTVPPDIVSFDSIQGREYLLQVAHRMGSLIMAYGFDVEEGDGKEKDGEDGYVTDDEGQSASKAMVPLTDVFRADVNRHNMRLYQDEGTFIVRASKAIAKGEELVSEHEEIPRSECLRRYGTAPEDCARFDVVDISRDIIFQEFAISNDEDARLSYLDELEILDDGYTIPRCSESVSVNKLVPKELIAVLYVLALPLEKVQLLIAKGKAPKPSLGFTESRGLLRAVKRRLSEYSTTLAEDEQLLSTLQRDLTKSQRRALMAIRVRKGEKEILVHLEDALQKHLEELENPDAVAMNGSSKSQNKRRKLWPSLIRDRRRELDEEF
ncbi:hypothetical protein KEM54_005913 [Ascosphaera aggregata]|nr:hypothetical protein KEM54_005913 [Ascosphaera aggregata]